MIRCSTCSTENVDGARFCASCGSPLGEACSNCGTAIPAGARFCPACGTPIEPLGPPGQERKLVTVLFADVTGSTELGERLDPERLRDVMASYFEAMRAEIEAEGGTVEKFIGDAVMAAFGVPSAHDDDPNRALRAALRMDARLESLNRDLLREHDVSLSMRIGVNTGEVLAVTEPRPGEAMVTGDAVNAAARLEQVAEPGQVLVAERTARAARGFRFRDLGTLEVKGKSEPLRAMELLGVTESPEAATRGVPGIRAPMVGREEEMALLRTVFQRVKAEKRPNLATIYGDPGVGKSRLTREFLDWVERQKPGPIVLAGRCLPYGEGLTYWPLAEILKSHAGVLDSDPADGALSKIRAAVDRLVTAEIAPEPNRTAAALAFTLGLEDPEHPFGHLAPRQVRLETHNAWRAFFSAIATESPAVVVIEDIHWADPAMLDLLEELADRLSGAALFLCPARPDLVQRRTDWGGGRRNYTSIFLEPLSREDADRLVGFLLSIEDLPHTVHERILTRAEGNPFFLEEILRRLIDEGRIIREGERWRATSEIADIQIPDTVQGVLAARIDLLGAEEKRTLQSAAVVGRVFWAGPVGELLNGEGERLDEILDQLERRELVAGRLGSTMAGEREFIFKHVLTRDVAYDSLPRRERANAHAEVAAWIERTVGGRTGEFAELLAHHYGEAFLGTRDTGEDAEAFRRNAFEYLVRASIGARSNLAVEKAERLADRALSLASVPEERAQAQEALGHAYQNSYQGDLAWKAFRDAADTLLAGTPEDRSAVARLCARAVEAPTRWPGSMTVVADADVVLRYLEIGLQHASDADSEELALLLTAKAFLPFAFPERMHEAADFEEARAAGEAAAEIAERLDRPDLVSAALDGAGSGLITRGLYGQIERLLRRRIHLATTVLEDPWELGDIYNMAAWVAFALGRYSEVVRLAEQGLKRTTMDAPGPGLACVSWKGIARWRLGEWDGVHEGVEDALALLGDRRTTPPAFSFPIFGASAFVHEARGNPGAADRILLEMRSSAQNRQDRPPPWLNLLEAEVLTRRGAYDEALALLDHPYLGKIFRGDLYEALQVRSRILAESESWDRAGELIQEMRAHAEEGELLALPFFADRLEGQAALAAGDASKAVDLLTRSRDGLAGLDAKWEAARVDLWLAEAEATTGQRESATVRLRSALDLFDKLGSLRERERARELLDGLA
ncbi:MAG TPA: adenylate/guanylate cyclase domain-containing protein [Actinomycetota bacterium]|nr:adenylate/guanylate cyclase domain-containing protein [Actinomycetota bacterium]